MAYMNNHSFDKCFFYILLTAILGWFRILLQLYLTVEVSNGLMPGEKIIRFFSYFTILTNILCAISLAAILMKPYNQAFISNPIILSAITTYTVIEGLQRLCRKVSKYSYSFAWCENCKAESHSETSTGELLSRINKARGTKRV
jgi:hypothetical protein